MAIAVTGSLKREESKLDFSSFFSTTTKHQTTTPTAPTWTSCPQIQGKGMAVKAVPKTELYEGTSQEVCLEGESIESTLLHT